MEQLSLFELKILDFIQAHFQCRFLDIFFSTVTKLADSGIFWILLAVVLLFAFRMLAAQTALAAAADDVAVLESRLMGINEENTKLKALVEAGVDLEYIYQVATGELGLVSVSDSQVIYYDQIESGYVRQNEIIP